MNTSPVIEILRGLPNDAEGQAIRLAILALVREDQSKPAQRESAWILAARTERGARGKSWRTALGLMQPGLHSARRVGRGDQR